MKIDFFEGGIFENGLVLIYTVSGPKNQMALSDFENFSYSMSHGLFKRAVII